MRYLSDRDLAKHLASPPLSLHSSLNFLPCIQNLPCIWQLPWQSLKFALVLGNLAHWGCWCWYPLFSAGRRDQEPAVPRGSHTAGTLLFPAAVTLSLWYLLGWNTRGKMAREQRECSQRVPLGKESFLVFRSIDSFEGRTGKWPWEWGKKREHVSCCYPKELKGHWEMKERCTDERQILHKRPWINEAVDRICANSDMSEEENGFIKALFKKKAFNAKWKRVGSEGMVVCKDSHWWKAEKKAARRSLNYMQNNRSELNLFNGMPIEFVSKPTSFLISLFIYFYICLHITGFKKTHEGRKKDKKKIY